MLTPVDITALPTARDLINARATIKELEIDLEAALLALEQAQLRVNRITQNLLERRAWIAPIRRLCYDVLSLVFEFCGEDSWKTPLRIAGVSRQWRDLVLATPRAWAFLDVHECPQNRRLEMVNHFFKHSGQQSLHVYLNPAQSLTVLSAVIERLECLSMSDIFGIGGYLSFPRLKRFSLIGRGGSTAISNINVTRFPALRELISGAIIEGDVASMPRSMRPTFPPLQVLSVATGENSGCRDLLMGCQSSLVSLRLIFEPPFPATSHLAFPMLKCLEITLWRPSPDGWPMDLKTPVIETYIERRRYYDGVKAPIHHDIGNVRQMRLNFAPKFLATPLLRSLELWEAADIKSILPQLGSSPDYFPNLELIEVQRLDPSDAYKDILEAVNTQRSQSIALRSAKIPPRVLPFEIAASPCGHSMPCRNPP